MNDKLRPLSCATEDHELSRVGLHYFFGNRHTKPGSFFLLRIEGDKNVFQSFLIHARTMILDPYYKVRPLVLCADDNVLPGPGSLNRIGE